MGRIYSKFKKHAVTSKVKKTGHFEKKTCHEHFKRIIATRLNDTWSHVMCKKKYANFAARSHVYKSMDGIKKNIFKIRLENYRGGIFFAWSMNAPVGTDIFMPRMFFDTWHERIWDKFREFQVKTIVKLGQDLAHEFLLAKLCQTMQTSSWPDARVLFPHIS